VAIWTVLIYGNIVMWPFGQLEIWSDRLHCYQWYA